MDFPALVECLAVSMSYDVAVMAGEDPQSVDGQDSEKSGCPSAAAKRWSDSCGLAEFRVLVCGQDRLVERAGLKVVFFFSLDRDWLQDGW